MRREGWRGERKRLGGEERGGNYGERRQRRCGRREDMRRCGKERGVKRVRGMARRGREGKRVRGVARRGREGVNRVRGGVARKGREAVARRKEENGWQGRGWRGEEV